ncbi:HNH endonuclease [Nonomuraea maritima]|uniref:HNH endonuclease n=1 Tax=Nonomuraea maritima TaxID=683260 RepID=A0A1G8ZIC4_9ACTN|nr:HNH endonuclease signature motif containing protein [Nonomuraea maritima]SDK14856.1 HNH endonuclease [Nonomuraea maritima]
MAAYIKYSREMLAEAAAQSRSVADVLRRLGIKWTGGSHAHISRRLKHFDIDTSHFVGQAHGKGRRPLTLRPYEQVLALRPAGSIREKAPVLRRALREAGVPYACAGCRIGGTWQRKPLTLHVDHINGDWLDNRMENLRFLCPNCHSQTDNYAGRGKTKKGS